MKELLTNFCFSKKENGLLLIDMPTGTGKTYNAIEFIYQNYKQIKNKIIFITNLKKNLPYSDLRKRFEKDNKLNDFEKDILFLDNNVDFLIDNFENVENSIPFEKFSKDGVIYNIRNCIHIISALKKSINNTENNSDSFVSKENVYLIINQEKENLQDKYEKQFRAIIEEELNYDENGTKRTKADKLNLINNDQNYQWIKKLYPAVSTDEKKIIFMSIDKFLVKNSTLIEPSYNIIDSNNLLKNSIIFIDEFDASKDVFLKKIINDSIDTKVHIIELFRLIYAGLENTDFSKMLTEISEHLQKQINSNKKIYSPFQIIEEFKSKAKEIDTEFNLKNFHKLDEINKDKASFLFQDYKFHTIIKDEKKNIYIENDKENKINWIKHSDENNFKETNIFSLLNKIKAFLVYFQNGIKFIADNYIHLKKQRKQETNNFSYEAAIKTVLSEFGLEGKYLTYLTSQILNTRKKRGQNIIDLKSDLDCSVYEKGFRFYNFIDSDTFDTQSKITCLSFNLSPEKILLYLCKMSKVVGMSASGTLKTVTGNYDLDYIKNKLGNDFYELTQEEKNRLNNYITQNLGDYSKVNIEIDKCPITSNNYVSFLNKILDKPNDKEILNKICKLDLDTFFKARYTKVIYAMNKFFDNNIKSFLFLTNTILSNSANFNYNLIKDVFELLRKKHNKPDAYFYSLEGSLEKFENLKEEIKNKLKNGKSIFVMSTYQTLGAGQNLQYEFSKELEDFIEPINDNNYNENFKDFDAIFLDKPTNLFVTLNKDVDEEQLLKYIYQVKSLEEVGYFTLDKAEMEIKKGIKIAYHASAQNISIPKSKHIYMHTAKVILQAIGRICRTKNKRKNIFISFDCSMEQDLSQVKNEILSKPINFELQELLSKCENINEEPLNPLDNINNSKDKKIFKEIESIRKFKTPSDISKWEELREIVLKHPFDNQGIHELYDIYCEFEEKTDHYYCAKVNKNEYKITGLNPNFITINEEFARLKLLLKIPDVKEYFISKGYATEFKKSKYLLLPNVFQKIYLGALGECVGEFLLNQYLSRFKLKLQRIEDINKYEKFDFVIGNDIYVDFKHWTGILDKDRESEVQKFLDKLNKIEGKIGFIINILKPENYDPKQYISPDENLIIIPYLYDTETNIYNLDALKIIDEYLLKKLSFAI